MHESTGGCHCGNISYRFVSAQAAAELPVRRCNCSFCRRHGATYTADPEGALDVEVNDPELVGSYRFATEVVDFIICRRCGVMPFALTTIDDRPYAVIAANSMDDIPAAEPTTLQLVDETAQEGMARRKRTWISRVSLKGWPDPLPAAVPR